MQNGRVPHISREVEITYAPDDDFDVPALPDLLERGGTARDADGLVPPVEGEVLQHELQATYFDTDDLRLAAAGLTLRRRTGGTDAGWHLKVPAGPGARNEVRLPLGRATRTVPQRLRQLVRAQTGETPLLPVASVTTDRTVHRLVDANGRVLAELADDQVTAERLVPSADGAEPAGTTTSWREIEVELVDGDEELLRELDAGLRARGLPLSPTASKLGRVLAVEQLGGAGSDTQAPRRPARQVASSPARDVVLPRLRELLGQLRAQDLRARMGTPGSVPAMREAARGLHGTVGAFARLFEDDVRPLRDELGWLVEELDAARDAETVRDRVRGTLRNVTPDEGGDEVADDVDAELESAAGAAHDRLVAELGGERYLGLLRALDDLLESPQLTEDAAGPAGEVLPALVERSDRRLRRAMETAHAAEGDERDALLQRTQDAAERARRAAETVTPVFRGKAPDLAEALEGLEEALGEHHDSLLTRGRLRELGMDAATTSEAFLRPTARARGDAGAGVA